jgi:PTH1 family peptidyl-tRNA hydrolase
MLLLVGLGNPGRGYAGNRHNIGFMALDEIARLHRASPWRARFHGEATEAVIGAEKALLLKPMTFMNLSGGPVQEAARFYKIEPADIVVFHDELDLGPAKLRVKTGGGNAGHNGLRSITGSVGNEYRRVRMGIGHPGDKALVHAYVLNDFGKEERPWVEDLCRACADLAPLLAARDDGHFQTKVALEMDKRGWAEVKRPGDRGGD